MTDTLAAQTRAVLEHHIEALIAGDVDAVLADYAPDVVFMFNGEVLTGRESLREVFAQAVAGPFKPGASSFTLETLVVEGPYGLITWQLSFEGGAITLGTDTVHVLDGQIVLQTGAAKVELAEG